MSGSALGQTSGTYNFNPSLGECILFAFGRCGIRRTEIIQQHLQDARIAANLILADWSNDQPNLWEVQETSVPCVVGQREYSVPSTVMLILEGWLRMNAGTANQQDFFMWPISRTEWAAFPQKNSPGQPTVYWFDRLISPTVTLWQVPTDASWEFVYFSVGQMQDAVLPNAGTLPIPYYFLKAFTDRLSAELAVIYAPERAEKLMVVATASWDKARNRNAESVPWFITPGLSGYTRVS